MQRRSATGLDAGLRATRCIGRAEDLRDKTNATVDRDSHGGGEADDRLSGAVKNADCGLLRSREGGALMTMQPGRVCREQPCRAERNESEDTAKRSFRLATGRRAGPSSSMARQWGPLRRRLVEPGLLLDISLRSC